MKFESLKRPENQTVTGAVSNKNQQVLKYLTFHLLATL